MGIAAVIEEILVTFVPLIIVVVALIIRLVDIRGGKHGKK